MKNHVRKITDIWKTEYAGQVNESQRYLLPKQLHRMAALFTPGQFYYYIIDIQTLQMEYVHSGVQEILGIPSSEVTVEKLLDKLEPRELDLLALKEKVVTDFFLNYLPTSDMLSYKYVYFFKTKDSLEKERIMLHQTCMLSLTSEGKPQHCLVVNTDVSEVRFYDQNSLSFLNLDGGKSYFGLPIEDGKFQPECSSHNLAVDFSEFSNREKEIIRKMAMGTNTDDIANQLYISVHTLRTHRKNIMRKSGCNNVYELVAQFVMAGLT